MIHRGLNDLYLAKGGFYLTLKIKKIKPISPKVVECRLNYLSRWLKKLNVI